MKKILLFAAALLLGAQLFADSIPVFTTQSTTTPSTPVQVDGFFSCYAQTWSDDGATATVNFEGSENQAGPWNIMATVTVTGGSKPYYSGMCPTWFRINPTNVSGGTLNATREGRK